jgi:hypothetical protein
MPRSPHARLAAALQRVLGPAGSSLAADAAAETRRMAGVAAVRGPPAVFKEGEAEPSASPPSATTSTATPVGAALTQAGAAGLATDWAALVDAVQAHHVSVRGWGMVRVRGWCESLSLSMSPSHARTAGPTTQNNNRSC